jgi:L-threonylcarbamoyladenylate synthase
MARLLTADPDAVAEAAGVLRAGGLVAFPTETVYGLGAAARDAEAVARVFTAKGRPADNPLIVHIADAAGLADLAADVPPAVRDLAARFWPGPLTLVVRARPGLPRVTTGGLDSVAVRVPGHPVALALLRAAGVPVAAPSANRSGRPSPTTAAHVLADLADRVDVVLDGGPTAIGVESTVVDVRSGAPVILRPGAVTPADLGLAGPGGGGDLAASPGTRYRHYAPACAVEIAPVGAGARVAAGLAAQGRAVGLVAPGRAPEGVVQVARPGDAAALGRVLYGALRAAESGGLDALVVEAVDDRGLGTAVMDRLRRAAGSDIKDYKRLL